MICEKCGKEIKNDSQFCSYCGGAASHGKCNEYDEYIAEKQWLDDEELLAMNKLEKKIFGFGLSSMMCFVFGLFVFGIILSFIGMKYSNDIKTGIGK